MKKLALLAGLVCLMTTTVFAQGPGTSDWVIGDPMPDAPELAPRGEYQIGVQTLTVVHKERLDILNQTEENPTPIYDRAITLEVWYPALVPDGQEALTTYEDFLTTAQVSFTFSGRALRDAEADASGAAYPLVVISHGYPGSRYLLSNLAENIASRGYVVVAIDHPESTHADQGGVDSSFLNRAYDQIFVLDEMQRLAGEDGFWNDLYDVENTALIGYSMGGFGVLNVIGAGYKGLVRIRTDDAIIPRLESNPEMTADPRIKAAVLIAPWGGALNLWSTTALAKISIPTFWIDGSKDDVASYDAVVSMFNQATSSDRYMLTYVNALHNVAPNPPEIGFEFGDYDHYADAVWDARRINNINQHFVAAFLGMTLKNDETMAPYLDLVEDSNDGLYAVDEAGNPTEAYTYWHGFKNRTAQGMLFWHESP